MCLYMCSPGKKEIKNDASKYNMYNTYCKKSGRFSKHING